MNNLLQPEAILFNQRNKEYIKLINEAEDHLIKFRGVDASVYTSIRRSEIEGKRWVYRIWEGNQWSRGNWYNLAIQLMTDCRTVGRLEALVILGIKL